MKPWLGTAGTPERQSRRSWLTALICDGSFNWPIAQLAPALREGGGHKLSGIDGLARRLDESAGWTDLEALFAPARPTLGDLPQWYELGGHCSRCEREGAIDRWRLQESVGADVHLYILRQFLRCRKCGNKGTNTWIAAKAAR